MSFFKKKDEFEISSYTYDLSFSQIVRFFIMFHMHQLNNLIFDNCD